MRYSAVVVIALIRVSFLASWASVQGESPQPFVVPKTWDQEAVESLQLPLADAGGTPTPITADYYGKIPVWKFAKTYPVYHPAHEPKFDGKDYLEWLKSRKSEPILTDFSAMRTEADWQSKGPALGKEVFEAVLADDREPSLAMARVADVRDPGWYESTGVPYDDRGLVPTLRYVVAEDGSIHVGTFSCAMCHTRVERLPDGRKLVISGAQGNFPFDRVRVPGRAGTPEGVQRAIDAFVNPFLFAAPWLDPDPIGAIRKATPAQVTAMHGAIPAGVMSRHGTSLLSPVQVPDLIGIQDRKYFDRTGLIRHRGIGDLMRYAALNQGMDYLNHYGKFVPASMLPGPTKWDEGLPEATKLPMIAGRRYSDEQLFALSLFLYSLHPPENPYKPKDDAQRQDVARGAKLFADRGCVKCHDPNQGYSNNKLVRAPGFQVPDDHPEKASILDRSVGTDPTLALQTRRGTGLYKIPSLRGAWYRGPFEHNGSVATLEDWFDPKRLENGYVPTAWKGPPDARTRAVKGHEFGLDLSREERAALIAFLKTL